MRRQRDTHSVSSRLGGAVWRRPASGAPQHFHNTAWNACVYGAKKWLVYPPAYALMSNEQIRKWDENDRSELEKDGQPAPLTCVQRAGDVAVVPEMWGHGVVNLEETLAVATSSRCTVSEANR